MSAYLGAYLLRTQKVKVYINDNRWLNILFYKCCYNEAAFRSANKGDINVEVAGNRTAIDIFSLLLVESDEKG
jgi:hypothetical protein